MSKIIRYELEYRGKDFPDKEVPIVQCDCGEEVYCDDSWANECFYCNTEYNGNGQKLNPRHMWGWETGETFR
jgi:hypothetical protein